MHSSPGFASRLARSPWRLPLLVLITAALFFGPMYLLRGMRLVNMGAMGLAALAACAAGFAYPFQALVVCVFLIYSGTDALLPGPLSVAALAIVVGRMAYDLLDRKRLDWGSTSHRISLALLMVTALTSLVVVQRYGLALLEARNIAAGLAMYLGISLYTDRPRRLAMLCLALALAVATSILLSIQRVLAVGLSGIPVLLASRFGALNTDPNVTAAEANCCIVLLLAAGTWLRGWKRWIMAPVLLVLIGTVIMTQSRAGLILLGVLALVLLLRVSRHGRGLVVFGVAVLAGTALFLPQIYWVRFVSIAQLRGIVVDRSLLLRAHALETGWAIFRGHPWLGVGLGNFTHHSPHYMLRAYVAHNTFLEVAATLGIVGLFVYVAWLWSGLSMARQAASLWSGPERRREHKLAQHVILALLAYFASALTLSICFYPFLWMLLGFANAARLCARRSQPA